MESFNYLDFELEISNSDQPDQYIAHVQRSPAGEAKANFELPFTADRLEVLTLKLSRLRSATRRVNSPEFSAAHELGTNLFKAIFKGQVRDRLRSSLEKTRSMEGTGLRLKLRFQDAPELANLPWEFLYDTDLERFLAQSIQTPIIRYLELPESTAPYEINLPLHILGMVSSPSDYRLLDVQQEKENLKNSLAPLVKSGQVKITWLEEPTMDNLRQALRQSEYHIFHFIGHGGFDNHRDQGILVFEDKNGKGSWADADRLGVLFHDHPSMRLVILNACEGARNSINDPFASVAATLVRQGIPSVVAMQFEISDSAAIDFASEFFTVLAQGFPVDLAVNEARKAIYTRQNDVEWGTPVLYLRAENGVLFDLQAKQSTPQAEKFLSAQAGSTLHPQDKPFTRQQKKTPDKKMDELYIEGVSAYWVKDWERAADIFQAIAAQQPDYKDVAAKLEDSLLQNRWKQLYLAAQYNLENENWDDATSNLEILISEAGDYQDADDLLEMSRTRKKLAGLLAEAQGLHQAEQWQAVVNVFEQIADIDPEFSDSDDLLAQAEENLAELKRQERLKLLYGQALIDMDAGHWQSALKLMEQVQELDPSYKEVELLIVRVKEEIEWDKTENQRQIEVTKDNGDAEGITKGAGKDLNYQESVNLAKKSLKVRKFKKLKGLDKQVNAVAFSPDGKLLASGSGGFLMSNDPIRIWRVTDGKAAVSISNLFSSIWSVAFSHDGLLLASGSSDNNIDIWDVQNGKKRNKLNGHTKAVSSVAFSPDDKLLASGSDDATVRLWQLPSGKKKKILRDHSQAVKCVSFSPDGNLIASGSDDSSVRIWQVKNNKQEIILKDHTASVKCLAFSPDGKLLASGSDDGTVRLWRIPSKKPMSVLEHGLTVDSLAFSPDGSLLASGSYDTRVRLWGTEDKKVIRYLSAPTDWVRSVAFSPDGSLLAAGGDDQIIHIWRLSTGEK
jgi:uncharacterized protein with WD repeat/outer membrane protein assembly factor BamD (BamD/ComL family)